MSCVTGSSCSPLADLQGISSTKCCASGPPATSNPTTPNNLPRVPSLGDGLWCVAALATAGGQIIIGVPPLRPRKQSAGLAHQPVGNEADPLLRGRVEVEQGAGARRVCGE